MQTFLIYCIHTYNDLRTLLNHTLLKSTKNSPQFQNKAGFTARISNRRSERLIWTVARVSFQMRPSMHRKARISNPTFKTFHKTQQERRNRPPLFAYPSPCPSDAAGALPSRSMASSMARLIKPFTLSLWTSAWALMISFLPFGIATDTRSRFAVSHFLLPSLRASVYFCGDICTTPF